MIQTISSVAIAMTVVTMVSADQSPVLAPRDHVHNFSTFVASAHQRKVTLYVTDNDDDSTVRGRRAVKDLCQDGRKTECSDEQPDECCKSCTIGTNDYKIDVNTFKDTLSRGTKKNPQDLWQYCGLPSNKVSGSWPREKDEHVGTLQFPFEEGKVQKNDPFNLPLDTEYHHNLPIKYTHTDNDKAVLFRKWSYRMMTGDMEQSLTDLAEEWNELDTPFNLLVYRGYEPLKNKDRRTVDSKDLYTEARQVQLLLVYNTIACESNCLQYDLEEPDTKCDKSVQNDDTECSINYPRYDTPNCLKDEFTDDDLEQCKDDKIISTNEYNYRLLADMAFKHFDHVLHAHVDDTSYDSVVVTARDSHRQCGATADIVFLLDGSKSVGTGGWEAQLDFVKNFAGGIKASADTARIGVATFSGPRYSHFADHLQDITVEVTDVTCATDNDCAHSVQENQGMLGTREVCNMVSKKCEEHVPAHCPVGTLYEGGTTSFEGEILSYGCVCSSSSTCSAGSFDRKWIPCQGDGVTNANLDDDECAAATESKERNYGCGEGYFEFVAGDCGEYTKAQRANGLYLDVGGISPEEFPNCEERAFFSQNCKECGCSGDDYKWDETHSSWTNFNLNTHDTAKDMIDAINAQHTKVVNGGVEEIEICPQIGHGSSKSRDILHTEDDYTAWHERDNFCFNNGASHLSLGLKHVIVGNKEHKGMFHPDNGARPLTENIPRVVIVLSDGKSNPHFEPYAWSDQLHAQNYEVFSVGMGFTAGKIGGVAERRDYLKELNDMASEPINRYRFDIAGDGHLSDILQHLTDGFCERPIVLPNGGSNGPGGFKITPQIDEGQATNYKITCARMTSTVFVVVDTLVGTTKVFVSGPPSIDGVREPTEFNSGLGGAEDVSTDAHKVVKFSRPDKTFTELYIGVANSDSDKAEFNIAVYLDLFEEAEPVVKGDIVSEDDFDNVIYTPAIKTGLKCVGNTDCTMADFDFTLLKLGANKLRGDDGETYFEWNGASIVLSAAGQARVADDLEFIIGDLELIAKHKTLGSIGTPVGCFDGMMKLTLEYDRTSFKVDWSEAQYDVNDLEEFAPDGTVLGGRQRRLAPTVGAQVAKVSATKAAGETAPGPSSYAIVSGNSAGGFAVDADGQVTVANPEVLDYERTKTFRLEIVAMNDEDLVSDPSVFVVINLKNVADKPFFDEQDAITNIDAKLGAQVAPGEVMLSVEIMNPGGLAPEEMSCDFAAASGSTSLWRISLNDDAGECKASGKSCYCDIAVGTNTKIGAGGDAERSDKVSVGLFFNNVEQDSEVITFYWPDFEGEVITEAMATPTTAAPVPCEDAETNAFKAYLGVDKMTCAELFDLGYCMTYEAAVALNDAAVAEDETADAVNFAAQDLQKEAYDQNQADVIFPACEATCGICGGGKDGGAGDDSGDDVTTEGPSSPCDTVKGITTTDCNYKGSCITEDVKEPYCECEYPYFGVGCETKMADENLPCKDENGVSPCVNGGTCSGARALPADAEKGAEVDITGPWNTYVCICPYTSPSKCWAGKTCSLTVECDGDGFRSCNQVARIGRAPKSKVICSIEPPCEPSPSNEYCYVGGVPVITAEEFDKIVNDNPANTTPDPGVNDASTGENKSSSVGAIVGGVLVAVILIAVLCVILIMWRNKNQQHEKTMAELRANKGKSRSSTTSRPKAGQSFAEGAYADVPASINPMDNPMYGMGASDGGDATYDDATMMTQSGAYQDIPGGAPVDGMGNPMYGMGGGADSTYSDVQQPASGAYLDVAPPAAPAADAAYLDVLPQANVEGLANPMYGMGQGVQGGGEATYGDASA